MELLRNEAVFINNVPETYHLPRDPDDEIYIKLALVTSAKFLVTCNTDLLDLMGKTEIGRDLEHRFPRLQALEPKDFLEKHSAMQQTLH